MRSAAMSSTTAPTNLSMRPKIPTVSASTKSAVGTVIPKSAERAGVLLQRRPQRGAELALPFLVEARGDEHLAERHFVGRVEDEPFPFQLRAQRAVKRCTCRALRRGLAIKPIGNRFPKLRRHAVPE